MYGVVFSDQIGLGTIITVIAAVILTVPTTLLAWNNLKAKLAEKARHNKESETNRIAKEVLSKLVGNNQIGVPSTPEHPSLYDLTTDINKKLATLEELGKLLCNHISDGHGGTTSSN